MSDPVYFDYKLIGAYLNLGDSVQVSPGPASYEGVADTVGPAVVLTVGGGPGLVLEGLLDRVFVAVDVAGDQNDPDSAITLARTVDVKMLAIDHAMTVGGVRVYGVTRAGGRPTPTSVDDGDRWHLACGYLWQVQSGV